MQIVVVDAWKIKFSPGETGAWYQIFSFRRVWWRWVKDCCCLQHSISYAAPRVCFEYIFAFFFFCSGGSDAAFKRNLSLKLEAQFLRTLACRAGVLGGVFMRGDATASSTGATDGGAAGMEVVDDDEGRGVLDKGKGKVVAGGIGGVVPGHLMRRLQTLSLRLVEKYALLSQKDRGLACQGLCQLCLALSGPGQGDNLSRMVRARVMLDD